MNKYSSGLPRPSVQMGLDNGFTSGHRIFRQLNPNPLLLKAMD
ncbi:MAG: hypothetical protein ACTILG_13225 [Sphingobacterium sp.]